MLSVVGNASAAWKEKVLYSFQGGSDGYQPTGGVVFDKAGNLYGVNSWGGSGGCPDPGCGTVFELSPPTRKGGAWTETTIYAFRGVLGNVKDGFTPEGGVIIDQAGNLYGTTSLGGNGPCILLGSATGCGTVYKLSPPKQKGSKWTETILHNFQTGMDGYFPWGDLVFDKDSNLYGATQFGGGEGTACNQFFGGTCGTVFKLHPPSIKNGKWKEDILHSFAGVAKKQQSGDGAIPNGGLILDSKGAVYGTTQLGGYQKETGCDPGGCGTAFQLGPSAHKSGSWSETILHRFKASANEARPGTGMTLDENGDLYGTTLGSLFRLKPPLRKSGGWEETILHTFVYGKGAYDPEGALILDHYGNLYGTTNIDRSFRGTVFRLKRPNQTSGKWTLGILYGFTGPPDGEFPAANLIFDKQGNLYSTTQQGGTGTCLGGCGAVFVVSP
jgi:uncharacterized repeat protein (TIGR03803 family)